MSMTRREAISTLAVGGLGLVTLGHATACSSEGTPPSQSGPFELPALPYALSALEPHIDATTMEIHHGRHHQAYVNGLNAAITATPAPAGRALDDLLVSVDTLPEAARTSVRNNGGGHANHMQFWTLLSPSGGGQPTGAIAEALTSTFGSFDTFRTQFNQAAASRFGSGWAWLSVDNGALKVHSTANQDAPQMEGLTPVFGVDVWEHAYYLHYQNRRADYVEAVWNLVDWNEVNRRLAAIG